MINTKIYKAVNSKDHMSSIALSMALLQIELGHTDAAARCLTFTHNCQFVVANVVQFLNHSVNLTKVCLVNVDKTVIEREY